MNICSSRAASPWDPGVPQRLGDPPGPLYPTEPMGPPYPTDPRTLEPPVFFVSIRAARTPWTFHVPQNSQDSRNAPCSSRILRARRALRQTGFTHAKPPPDKQPLAPPARPARPFSTTSSGQRQVRGPAPGAAPAPPALPAPQEHPDLLLGTSETSGSTLTSSPAPPGIPNVPTQLPPFFCTPFSPPDTPYSPPCADRHLLPFCTPEPPPQHPLL